MGEQSRSQPARSLPTTGRPAGDFVPVVVRFRRQQTWNRRVRVDQVTGAQDGPVSPRDASSFAKSGCGLDSGRPTSMGVDSHFACWAE